MTRSEYRKLLGNPPEELKRLMQEMSCDFKDMQRLLGAWDIDLPEALETYRRKFGKIFEGNPRLFMEICTVAIMLITGASVLEDRYSEFTRYPA